SSDRAGERLQPGSVGTEYPLSERLKSVSHTVVDPLNALIRLAFGRPVICSKPSRSGVRFVMLDPPTFSHASNAMLPLAPPTDCGGIARKLNWFGPSWNRSVVGW